MSQSPKPPSKGKGGDDTVTQNYKGRAGREIDQGALAEQGSFAAQVAKEAARRIEEQIAKDMKKDSGELPLREFSTSSTAASTSPKDEQNLSRVQSRKGLGLKGLLIPNAKDPAAQAKAIEDAKRADANKETMKIVSPEARDDKRNKSKGWGPYKPPGLGGA